MESLKEEMISKWRDGSGNLKVENQDHFNEPLGTVNCEGLKVEKAFYLLSPVAGDILLNDAEFGGPVRPTTRDVQGNLEANGITVKEGTFVVNERRLKGSFEAKEASFEKLHIHGGHPVCEAEKLIDLTGVEVDHLYLYPLFQGTIKLTEGEIGLFEYQGLEKTQLEPHQVPGEPKLNLEGTRIDNYAFPGDLPNMNYIPSLSGKVLINEQTELPNSLKIAFERGRA